MQTHLIETLCKTSTTSFYTDTTKKSKKNLVYKFSQVELQGSGDFNWRVSDCEELLGVTQRMMGQISKAGEAFQALK